MSMAHAKRFAVGGCILFFASIAVAGKPLIDRTFTDASLAEIADCGTFQILDQFELSSPIWAAGL